MNHPAKKPTCTDIGWEAYDTCSRCDYITYAELSIDPNNHDLVHHEAKAATCTEIGWEAYDTCSRCDYTTYAELPIDPDNHDLMHHEAEEPTCTGIGWKAYDTCKRCNYTTYETIPALSHWYGEWTPNDNGGHSASCKRGCGYRGAVMCELFDYVLLAGDEKEDAFRLCPVCGIVSDGTRLELMEKAMAKALTRWLPAGEAVVRLGRIQNGEMLLSVAFEYAGRLTQSTGVVQITLPAEALEGFTLSILSSDGTEEPLPYSLEDGKAVLVLDFTAAETPVQLIHLIPAA